MSHAVSAVLLSLLSGCGSSSSGPGQADLSDLILVTSDATVLTGQIIPSQDIIVLVLDATNTPVSDATITLQAPAGWTVHHDTLVAPAAEGTGSITVTASRGGSHVQSTIHISAITDLRTHGPWTLEFGCQPKDTSYHVDSLVIVAQVDSLVRIAPAVAQSQLRIWRMYYEQDSVTLYGHTGITFVTSFSPDNVEIVPVPDTLKFDLSFDIYNQKANEAVRPNKSLWRYVMPSLEWCAITDYDQSGYVPNGRSASLSAP